LSPFRADSFPRRGGAVGKIVAENPGVSASGFFVAVLYFQKRKLA
jgi:hypothetical protein